LNFIRPIGFVVLVQYQSPPEIPLTYFDSFLIRRLGYVDTDWLSSNWRLQ